jgi:hypothetical protein
MRSVEAGRLARLQRRNDRDRFVHFLCADFVAGVFPKALKLSIRRSAETKPKHRATSGEGVERYDLPSHFPGTAARERRYERAEPDLVCSCGYRGKSYPGVNHRDVRMPMEQDMVP